MEIAPRAARSSSVAGMASRVTSKPFVRRFATAGDSSERSGVDGPSAGRTGWRKMRKAAVAMSQGSEAAPAAMSIVGLSRGPIGMPVSRPGRERIAITTAIRSVAPRKIHGFWAVTLICMGESYLGR